MNNGIKLMGIGCVTVALICSFIFVPDKPQIWGPLIGILAFLLGAPIVVAKIRKHRATARGDTDAVRKINEGLKLTWAEHHAFVSGIGDGLALSKAEKIPTIQETQDDYKETDFYAIIAREAWYYKMGAGIGRFTWGGVILGMIVWFVL